MVATISRYGDIHYPKGQKFSTAHLVERAIERKEKRLGRELTLEERFAFKPLDYYYAVRLRVPVVDRGFTRSYLNLTEQEDYTQFLPISRATPDDPWYPLPNWAEGNMFMSNKAIEAEQRIIELCLGALTDPVSECVLRHIHLHFPKSQQHCLFHVEYDKALHREYVELEVTSWMNESIRHPNQFLIGIAKSCNRGLADAGLI